MSLNTSFLFHNGANPPDLLIDFFITYLMAEGINRLRKKYLNLYKFNFRKTFGWLKIGFHLVSLVTVGTLGLKLEKIRLKRLSKICDKIVFHDIKRGLMIFVRIEPEISETIFGIINQLYEDYKIYKTTGIKTALLQRYLPDLV